MSALVVFDCFDTLVTSRPLPGPSSSPPRSPRRWRWTAGRGRGREDGLRHRVRRHDGHLRAPARDAGPAGRRAARAGRARDRPAMDEALWQALGCADPDQYALCEPVADAMRRVADAGHTVRLLSNCYLPGP
ncbi:hypothetical protein NKH77_43610 [Streptomyces sp. M19]